MAATIERRHDLEEAVNKFTDAPDDDTDDTDDDDTEPQVKRGPGRPPGSGTGGSVKSREERVNAWASRMLAKKRAALDATFERYRNVIDAKLQLKLDAIALSAGNRASNPAAVRDSLARQVARYEERLREMQEQLAKLSDDTADAAE